MFYIWEVLRKHFSSLSNNIQYNQVSCSILRQSRVQNLEKFKKIAKKWYYSIFVFSIFMMIFSFSELKYEYRSKFQGFKNCLHICGSCRTLFLSNWINIKNFISKKLTPTPKIQKPVIGVRFQNGSYFGATYSSYSINFNYSNVLFGIHTLYTRPWVILYAFSVCYGSSVFLSVCLFVRTLRPMCTRD